MSFHLDRTGQLTSLEGRRTSINHLHEAVIGLGKGDATFVARTAGYRRKIAGDDSAESTE